MTAFKILQQALADGLTLTLADPGTISVQGPPEARARHLPAIRRHKPELLKVLSEPDPWTALYASWLAGIDQPRALVTLDAAQVREAVAAGVVPRDLAQTSVLLLVKVPKSETGPVAVGVLAIPRERYADFSPTAALEAMTWQH
jgi:hypothetical protein